MSNVDPLIAQLDTLLPRVVVATVIGINGVRHNIIGKVCKHLTDAEAATFKLPNQFTDQGDRDLIKYVYGCEFSFVPTETANTTDIWNTDGDIDEEWKPHISKLVYGSLSDQPYLFVTKSNLQEIFPLDYDGDTLVNILNTEYAVGSHCSYEEADCGRFIIRNPALKAMKENSLHRDVLSDMFWNYIGKHDNLMDKLDAAVNGNHVVGNFRVWRDTEAGDDMFYILHLTSGTLLGWYKMGHYGRANVTNALKTNADLMDFLTLFRNQLAGEADEAETFASDIKVAEVDFSAADDNKIQTVNAGAPASKFDKLMVAPHGRYTKFIDDMLELVTADIDAAGFKLIMTTTGVGEEGFGPWRVYDHESDPSQFFMTDTVSIARRAYPNIGFKIVSCMLKVKEVIEVLVENMGVKITYTKSAYDDSGGCKTDTVEGLDNIRMEYPHHMYSTHFKPVVENLLTSIAEVWMQCTTSSDSKEE